MLVIGTGGAGLRAAIELAEAGIDGIAVGKHAKEDVACTPSDYPALDPALQVNLVWSPTTGVTRESIPAVPDGIASLPGEVSTEGKLVE